MSLIASGRLLLARRLARTVGTPPLWSALVGRHTGFASRSSCKLRSSLNPLCCLRLLRRRVRPLYRAQFECRAARTRIMLSLPVSPLHPSLPFFTSPIHLQARCPETLARSSTTRAPSSRPVSPWGTSSRTSCVQLASHSIHDLESHFEIQAVHGQAATGSRAPRLPDVQKRGAFDLACKHHAGFVALLQV